MPGVAVPVAGATPAAAATAPPTAARPQPLPRGLPVPTGESDDGMRIAATLHRAVRASGVFYESHLREWLEGRRTTAEVRAEALLRAAASPAGEPDAPERVRGQQVDLLRYGEVAWTLPPPWHAGDTFGIAEEPPPTWQSPEPRACLRLDLAVPGRGRVGVLLRAEGTTLEARLAEQDGLLLDDEEVAALARRLASIPGVRLSLARTRAP
jgi:hypothetical protein